MGTRVPTTLENRKEEDEDEKDDEEHKKEQKKDNQKNKKWTVNSAQRTFHSVGYLEFTSKMHIHQLGNLYSLKVEFKLSGRSPLTFYLADEEGALIMTYISALVNCKVNSSKIDASENAAASIVHCMLKTR